MPSLGGHLDAEGVCVLLESSPDGFECGSVTAGLLVDASDRAHGGLEVALAGFTFVLVGAAVTGAGGVGEAEAGAAAEHVCGGRACRWVSCDEVVKVLLALSAGWAGPPVAFAEVLLGFDDVEFVGVGSGVQGEEEAVRVKVAADGGALLSVEGVEVVDGVLDVEDGLGFVDAGGAGALVAVAVSGDVDELVGVGVEEADVVWIGWAEPAVAVAGVDGGFTPGAVPFVVGGGCSLGGHGCLRY